MSLLRQTFAWSDTCEIEPVAQRVPFRWKTLCATWRDVKEGCRCVCVCGTDTDTDFFWFGFLGTNYISKQTQEVR